MESIDAAGRRYGAVWVFLLLLAALRVLFAWHMPFDSDEAQHLHVAWSWTQGLLPYRDAFDNHTPLFQFLSAPLLALIGESGDAVRWMRFAVLPWYALALWCTWRIGRVFYGRRVGLSAMALVAVFPDFFVLSVQYRTDDAWAPAWLAMVMVAVEGRPTPRRAFAVGVLAGTAVAISLKSLVLIVALVLAALFTLALMHFARQSLPWRTLARTGGALAGGFLVVPAVIVAGFALAGAWDAMVYCTVLHNIVPGDARWQATGARFWLFPCSLPLLAAIARTLMRDRVSTERGAKRAFVFLAAMLYFALLTSYWPLTPRQDWLPFAPFAAIYLVAGIRRFSRALPRVRASVVLGALLVLETAALVVEYRPWIDGTATARADLADVLRLTDVHDSVMDAKGESIFRHRPFYYALESVTRARMRLGLIPDTIVERLVATGTAVVQTAKLGGATLAFVEKHYLPVTPRWRVAGARLPAARAGEEVAFTLGVPARYAIRAGGVAVAGILDGVRYEGPRELAPGVHRFVPDRAQGIAVVLWAQAIERGFDALDETVPAPPDGGAPRP